MATLGCGPSNSEQLNEIGKKHTIKLFELTFKAGEVFTFTEVELEKLSDDWLSTSVEFQQIIYIDQNGIPANYQLELSNGFEMEYDAHFLKENGRHYLSLLFWDEGGGFQADVWTHVVELDPVLKIDRLNELNELAENQKKLAE